MKETLFLLIAILAEVVGTSALKAADGFKHLKPSILSMICYIALLYFLSVAMRTIPVGIVYAVWAGLGIVLMTLVGVFYYHENLNLYQILGIIFIILGVIMLNLLGHK